MKKILWRESEGKYRTKKRTRSRIEEDGKELGGCRVEGVRVRRRFNTTRRYLKGRGGDSAMNRA